MGQLQARLSGDGKRSSVPYKAGSAGSYEKVSESDQHGAMDQALRRRNYEICMVFKHRGKEAESDPSTAQIWQQQRDSILKRLENVGLHIFSFYGRDRDAIICKISADANKLRNTAARSKYKLKLKPEHLGAYAEYRHDFPGRPEMNFTDRRVVSHIYEKHAEEDFSHEDDDIFSPLDKVLLTHHIITSSDKDCAGIDIGNLMHQQDQLLKAYFPLHDSNTLQYMRENEWRWIFMGEEHTTAVREYFGDQIAFYFLWLSFYGKFLLPLALLGPVLQFVDLCFKTPENPSVIPFCLLTSIWATLLPHFWRRQEAKCALSWGSREMEDKLEPCRPEHWGEPRINPVTAQVEPFYPFEQRIWKYMFSGVVVIFSGVLLIFFICLLLFVRHVRKAATPGGVVLFQMLLAIAVECMNVVLSRIAKRLTDMENHRTRSDHEIHQLAKVMGFKFVNSYFSLYYIAFFKDSISLFGGEPLGCERGDCLGDVESQLACFMIVRLVFKNLYELLRPRVSKAYKTWQTSGKAWVTVLQGGHQSEPADMSNSEQQARKEIQNTFAEFDDTLLSHGYATLFAVAAPWVCTANLLGTMAEIYVTMRGLTETKQRSLPQKCKNNEPWSSAFELYGVVAAFTNVALLIFASKQYETWTLTEKLVLFIFLEQIIFLSILAVRIVLPRDPRSVELLQLRQQTVVHRCLENIKVEPGTDMSMFRDKTHLDYEVFEHDLAEEEDDEPQLNLKESWSAVKEAGRDVFSWSGHGG